MSDHQFVDIHYHAGPDTLRRRHTVLQAGNVYREIHGWVVVKSHLVSTTNAAWEARQLGLPVSGSLVLNDFAGGLQWQLVHQAVLSHGPDSPVRPIVYLPTIAGSGAHLTAADVFHPHVVQRAAPTLISDENGKLTKSCIDVIKSCADAPVVLATGHSRRDLVLRVIDQALTCGVERVVITHATHPLVGLTNCDLIELTATEQVHIELTGLTYILKRQSEAELLDSILLNPRTVLSSDLGQPAQPTVDVWLAYTQEWMTAHGIERDIQHALLVRNAENLIAN